MQPNRAVLYFTFVVGLAAAVIPAAANFDWESTGGVLAGAGAIATAAWKFLEGWQRHEDRIGAGVEPAPLELGLEAPEDEEMDDIALPDEDPDVSGADESLPLTPGAEAR